MARKVISKDDARERRKIQNRINQENYRKRRKLEEERKKASTDPQSATTSPDGTDEEPSKAARRQHRGVEEALSGASCSAEETEPPEHLNSRQLPLSEQVAHVDQTFQNSIENTKDPSVQHGLQESLTGTNRGYENILNSLPNIQISPMQRLLPGNHLPLPQNLRFQHEQQQHKQQQHESTTTWGGTHITKTKNASTWTYELYKVGCVVRKARKRKLVKEYRQSLQQTSRLASPPEAFESNTSKASQAWGRVND